jgi:hypothetical protein
MLTKNEAVLKLEAAFPGVPFNVRRGSYSRGTNDGRDVLEVSYNYKRFPLAPVAVSAILGGNPVWARGL